MKALFPAYRVLATVVGVCIIVLVVIGVPLRYAHNVWPDFWTSFLQNGEPGYKLGNWLCLYVGVMHGFVYLAFLLCVLLIAATMRWRIPFLVVILVSGLIPFLTFWAEARVIRRVRASYPEFRKNAVVPQTESDSHV